MVDRWPIPNGGYGQIIVIEPKDATDGGLRALGEELTYDTRGDRNAFIQVFSAQRAALMRKSGSLEALSRKDGAFYDDHTVGSYTRNANTGENVFTITPKGLNGPEADLKYQDRDSTA